MSKSILYHNPRCSKSREALALLEKKKISFEIKEYLKDTPCADEILNLAKALNKNPLEFIRTKEQTFKDLKLAGKEKSPEEWAKIVAKNPILLERPILLHKGKAVVGRPPEEVLKIL